MAENIFKVYRGGLWHNESENNRYEHIKTALRRFCDRDYDYLDLVWHIKNAVVGDIFMSESVYQGYQNGVLWIRANAVKRRIIDRIANHNTRVVGSQSFDETLMEIRKWIGKNEHAHNAPSLRFEHVVPAKIYINELLHAYQSGKFDLGFFTQFRDSVSVCIVTSSEETKLSQAFRQSMPNGWKWGNNKMARYDQVGIIVH
ncbi:MAG: hypothetical protein IJG35_03360 [Bacteroidales bacterium]|nr:hypothetical protein [Bacteroidales bacterium]